MSKDFWKSMNTAPTQRPLPNACFHFSVMDMSMPSVDRPFTETPLIPVFNTAISDVLVDNTTHLAVKKLAGNR